jgi:hypothetical protein
LEIKEKAERENIPLEISELVKNILNYLKKLFTNKEEQVSMAHAAIAAKGS